MSSSPALRVRASCTCREFISDSQRYIGTGKSVLLRAIIDELRPSMGQRLVVTASTGIAACNIGGCTLHSFAGFGLGKLPKELLPFRINERNKKRWRETQALIIDESELYVV